MILFKKIRWKNLLSTGNQFTQVDFTTYSTNLIIGSNGAGKSTILDALCFSLFGKPFRKINKPQLMNTVNEKDCLVEVEFSIGNTDWKVVRGIKPNVFQIYRNDTALDQSASANDQQKWLEQNVLKMNYKSFTQIVILGSSSFVPFMQLSAAHRREVIEDLLDIKIFSSMNNLIKDKIRSSRETTKLLTLKKDNLLDKVKMQEDFIDELKSRGNEQIENNHSKVSKLEEYIAANDEQSADLQKEVDQLNVEMEKVSESKESDFIAVKAKLSQKASTLAKTHKFFTDNKVCPTCTQPIEEDLRLNKISTIQEQVNDLKSGLEEVSSRISEETKKSQEFVRLSKESSKVINAINQNNTKVREYRRQIKDLESEIQRLTTNLANQNIEHEKLEEFNGSLQEVYEEVSAIKETVAYYDFTYSLLKDGGVKTKIVKKYLPLINQQVNRYLQMMDFYINFSLDEEFNETVQSPIHEDFSYASFSEGEKMRIDLALLFTWREVARMKNSVNTNLLIMDEVFDSSLDGFGTEEFLKIIKYVIKDANVFVISHKQDLHDKFDNVMRFEKVKGFSSLVS